MSNPMLPPVKISQAIRMVTLAIQAQLVPMIHGSPAIGKSGIVHQIAKDHNLFLIDLRLSQCDPTDLMGFPSIQGERAGYVPMDTFPIEGDKLPVKADGSSYAGWMLFLDEFNSASKAVQAAAYKIVLDRMVGKYHLHSKVAIVCAGNLETDSAIVEQMSTALQSRIVHMDLVADSAEWVKWATENDIDHRIISFINYKPGLLYTFKPDHSDRTYAAPRTWQFTDRLLKITDINNSDLRPLLCGTITAGVAHEFLLFCDIYKDLPTIPEIISNGANMRMPEEPSVMFAITGSIAHHATTLNIGDLMKYVVRLPIEFQIVCLKQVLARNEALINNADVQNWVSKNATQLF